MERRAAAAAAVAALVLLAGCQALVGEDGRDVRGMPTTTPSPTATPTPTPALADVTMPPGVAESGVTDLDALMGAHAGALEGESATVAIDFRLTVNGSGRNVSFLGRTVPGSDRGWIRVRLPDGVGTYYTEGDTTYGKEVVGGETRYGTTDQVSALPQRPRFGADERVRQAVGSANWTATGVVVRDGRRLIRLEATDVEVPEVNTSGGTTVSSSGVLLVDERGVVRRVEVGARVETERGTVAYAIEVTLSDVGTTTIEEPDWVERARNGG